MLLTNTYVYYTRLCDDRNIEKKHRSTHLEFRKEIAMAWINYPLYMEDLQRGKISSARKRKGTGEAYATRSLSPITLDSTLEGSSVASTVVRNHKKRKVVVKAPYITDSSLGIGGALSCRFITALDHLPVGVQSNGKSSVKCGMHRWFETQVTSQMLYCQTCRVNLCVKCYKIFHKKQTLLNARRSSGRSSVGSKHLEDLN